MPAAQPLPFKGGFVNPDDYVQSLLSFITSSELFQTLCGGVHILDFLTKEPDLYSTIVPENWREWFQLHDVSVILDLLMREDDEILEDLIASHNGLVKPSRPGLLWRNSANPPLSLLEYIQSIRKHALNRDLNPHIGRLASQCSKDATFLPPHVTVGMKPKKIHEVENFSQYCHTLIADIDTSRSQKITHVVDFGSGQNYLGRALASPPYIKKVVALESKQLNITGAKSMDITAKLAQKEKIMRNKKEYRAGSQTTLLDKTASSAGVLRHDIDIRGRASMGIGNIINERSSIQYIETFIEDGDLSNVVSTLRLDSSQDEVKPGLIVISLHSCGNLVHHGLRSLIVNPSVIAVAMVGCCYNLVTEKLGPTYKLPSLRIPNERLDRTSSARDHHGFPMSDCLATYSHSQGQGIRLNITARMMACQAPQNWTVMECESFFTRHFYRALLQRILVDCGVIGKPGGRDSTGADPALTIGSLRKHLYRSFKIYVRGAISKLSKDKERGAEIETLMEGLMDEEIDFYEDKYKEKKKELSIVWSLMAFSASVVEATIVVDRWLYLMEQPEVKDCWVEAVFEYKQSPRNLVVVGIKN